MRRQARLSAGGALVVRTASALQVWLWLLIFIFQNEFQISRTIKPGYLDFDNLPETNFTCDGKVIGGYYADLETSCQMFHVCTVGQQEETMDIKFLCLNGTVFDQETRVCERVDEVDCTKSERYYSLNLELYGSTAPPIIQTDQQKVQAQSTEQSHQKTKPSHEQEADPTIGDSSTTTTHESSKPNSHTSEVADSTEDPIQEIKKDEPYHYNHPTHNPIQVPEQEEAEDYQEDEEGIEYEDYSHQPTTTSTSPPTTTTRTTARPTTRPITTTTAKPPATTILISPPSSLRPSPLTHLLSSPSPSPALSSLSPPSYSSLSPSVSSLPTLDPSHLSPQEFIYRHRGPSSDAISFQRQSFRPADGVYITHAPPQQFDHFQYESSRTAPRPSAPRPAPFVQRPQPSPFRPTTLDPRDQLLRPGPTFQPSERHETSVKHKQQLFSSALPPQRPLPLYYDRKRSEDSEDESSLSPRSVAPPTVTNRPPSKPKSPPRVIVTASASVSDSNGKRLNYTVGNVVSAVKPIVKINYDDYKESDLLFDPFFLDVPKLQKRRKNRSYRNRTAFNGADTVTVTVNTWGKTTVTTSPVTSRATTTERPTTTPATTTTTVAWNPNDYVDDNYEPHAYIPPVPPLAILVPQDRNKFRKPERQSIIELVDENVQHEVVSEVDRSHQSRPTSSAAQTTSSQSAGAEAAPLVASLPPPPPLEAPACATSHSTDCRTRA